MISNFIINNFSNSILKQKTRLQNVLNVSLLVLLLEFQLLSFTVVCSENNEIILLCIHEKCIYFFINTYII